MRDGINNIIIVYYKIESIDERDVRYIFAAKLEGQCSQ